MLLNTNQGVYDPNHLNFAMENIGVFVRKNDLIELLDKLDPFERAFMIGLPLSAFGGKGKILDTEEETNDYYYSEFKERLEKLGNVIMDHVLVHSVVMHIANHLRLETNPEYRKYRTKLMQSFADHTLGDPGIDNEKWQREAEASKVQEKSDLEIAQRRYKLFCESVITPLMQKNYHDPKYNRPD